MHCTSEDQRPRRELRRLRQLTLCTCCELAVTFSALQSLCEGGSGSYASAHRGALAVGPSVRRLRFAAISPTACPLADGALSPCQTFLDRRPRRWPRPRRRTFASGATSGPMSRTDAAPTMCVSRTAPGSVLMGLTASHRPQCRVWRRNLVPCRLSRACPASRGRRAWTYSTARPLTGMQDDADAEHPDAPARAPGRARADAIAFGPAYHRRSSSCHRGLSTP